MSSEPQNPLTVPDLLWIVVAAVLAGLAISFDPGGWGIGLVFVIVGLVALFVFLRYRFS